MDDSESNAIDILKSNGLKISIPKDIPGSENGSDGTSDSESVQSYETGSKILGSEHSAPIELITEFMSTVMLKNYDKALILCKKLLEYEPDNDVVNKFYLIITERLRLIEEEEYSEECRSSESDDSSDETSDSDDSSSATDSDATTATWSSVDDDVNVTKNSTQCEEEKIDTETPAFEGTSSDNNFTTAQSSTEIIDKLRAKVVHTKRNNKK